MGRVIVHIDLNAFFVRAEEIKDHTLINKPVAIGHDGRGGIVSTSSYEARKYGVVSGMPMFKAKMLCPNLIIRNGDYRYYEVLSKEFIKVISSYTDLIEQASIDECYADFTMQIQNIKNPVKYFMDIQKDLYRKTKLQCSIGIGSTKFLAKMGSDYKKPMGLTIIRNKDIAKILYPLPIEKMYGIGKKTCPRLKEIGINTIGDLAIQCNNENDELKKILGKFTSTISDWLNGKGDNQICNEKSDPKSIGHSSTFQKDTNNIEDIKDMLKALSKKVSERAKEERKYGNTIQLIVKESNFKIHNKSITFKNPTNNWNTIYNYAYDLYSENFVDMTIRLIGITLQNLINLEQIAIQLSLFENEEKDENLETKQLIDQLNSKLKKPLIMRASDIKK